MARAVWKGVIEAADVEVPVKLYSAVADRAVHFRLLHEPDLVPIEQRMVNAVTGEVVASDAIRRGVETEEGIVVLEPDELAALEPESSRTIEVLQFVPPETIDHRWYVRPYWLGPDGSEGPYAGLVRALEKAGLEGVARWTMRKKPYRGALRPRDGRLMLVTLRAPDEVVSAAGIDRPAGRAMASKERELAERLIGALTGRFDPAAYRDDYRRRVLDLIEAKASGQTVSFPRPRRAKRPASLSEALEASLARAGEKSVA